MRAFNHRNKANGGLTVEVQKCINCYIVNCYPYIAALDTSTAAPGLGRRRWQSLRLILALGVQVRGGEALPDKSVYSLFHPVPAEWMRELSTDRPDQTESPYTVDAGHLQLELDFLTATVDREQSAGSDVRTTVWGVGPLNFKIGLLNQLDVQFVLDTHVHSRLEDRLAGTVEKASGLGDWQTRLKLNLWGNDGGRTALAVMPFVKWPLARSKPTALTRSWPAVLTQSWPLRGDGVGRRRRVPRKNPCPTSTHACRFW